MLTALRNWSHLIFLWLVTTPVIILLITMTTWCLGHNKPHSKPRWSRQAVISKGNTAGCIFYVRKDWSLGHKRNADSSSWSRKMPQYRALVTFTYTILCYSQLCFISHTIDWEERRTVWHCILLNKTANGLLYLALSYYIYIFFC